MAEIEVICPLKASDLRTDAPAGVTIEDRGEIIAKSIDSETLFVIGISWVASVPANLISTFLYERIKKSCCNPPKNISINDSPVEFRHDLLASHILHFTGGSK